MADEQKREHSQDPDPIKHSDAERVTSEETERVPKAEDPEPRDEKSAPTS
jgi:hypothetical protein